MKCLAIIILTFVFIGVSMNSAFANEYDIPDPVFKKLILEKLGKPDGELNPEDFDAMSKEKSLSLYDDDIKSIEGIQNYKSIHTLSLYHTQITDLTPLKDLKHLEIIDITSNAVIDLSPLANLEKIYWLTISDMPIEDLSPFSDLANLESLCLMNTKIVNFNPVPSLLKIKGLIIFTRQIVDSESIGKWINLEMLSISLLNFDMMDIEETPEDKDFSNMMPFDLNHFSELIKLEALSINYPKLVNYKEISKLKNLKWLTLSSMDTVDLAFLSGLDNLEEIELDIPGISDLKPLSGLDNLQSIRIEKNNLDDISPLFDLKNLKDVSIVFKPGSEDVIKDQLERLKKHGVDAKRGFLDTSCVLTLRALGSSQLAFWDENPEKNYGTWDELVESGYIREGWTRETMIDDYTIAVFEVTPSQKDEAGNIIKESTFRFVAVPSDLNSYRIYAIDESQTPKVWIGNESEWDINKLDLSDEDLWMSMR